MSNTYPKTHISPLVPKTLGLSWCINPYLHPQNTFSNFNVWQNTIGNTASHTATINLQAATHLETLFEKQDWNQKIISLSGNVDCYNKLEGKLKLTRSLLKLCLQYNNPVCIITRNDLILRDIDLLIRLQKQNLLQVFVQTNTTKNEVRAKLEPTSTNYYNRILLLKTLIDNGIDAGVMIAPIIKGLTDTCVNKIVADAKHVGVTKIYSSYLNVKPQDATSYEAWFKNNFNGLALRVDF